MSRPIAEARTPVSGVLASNSSGAEHGERMLWQPPCPDPSWCIWERRFSPAREPAVEARFTVSNGMLGIRGALEEAEPGPHPRILVADLFDPRDTQPPVPALVPPPDWLGLRVFVDGDLLARGTPGVSGHTRTLDFRRAAVWRQWQYRSPTGCTIHVRTVRFASAVRRHLAVHLTEITADFPVEVSLEEPRLDHQIELALIGAEGPVTIWETNHWRRRLALARVAMLILGTGEPVRPVDLREGTPLRLALEPNRPVVLVRIIAMVPAASGENPSREAMAIIEEACRLGPDRLFAEHVQAWETRWEASDVQIAGDDEAQRALRFAVYHLNSAVNPDNSHVSVSARGLTGDAYWGHVFWDADIFMLPFYALTWPEAARTMLMYRYHGLGAAREKARRFGYRGALYAWEAAENGEEAAPEFVYTPEGERIEIKTGTQEHHISADVAYAVWQYWRMTGDDEFLRDAGAEIILETARFWASRATLGPDGRYHILRVIGPDEYHEDVDDNAYTNMLAQWNLRRGREVARLLRQRWPDRWAALRRRLRITAAELKSWRDVARGLAISIDPSTGVIEQFAGYFSLTPIDLKAYEPRTLPMDVLLGREATQRSQVIKQPDVLMLIALLWDRFTPRQRRANFAYYEPRCGHGSSLSPPIHALLSARLGDLSLAERYFRQAAAIDLEDGMGNAASGIHLAAQGGVWQAAVFGFGGLQIRRDGLEINPHLLPRWKTLAFRAQWHGRRVRIAIEQVPYSVTATLERGQPLTIHIRGQSTTLHEGESWTRPLRRRATRGLTAAAN